VIDDPDIDIVVEVIGGTGSPARDLVMDSGRAGKAVVTANKALLADSLPELRKVFNSRKRALGYEASVAGGVPIIRVLQQSILPDSVTSIQGILNGTTNFILSGMAGGGKSYAQVLQEAQRAGFAETDPTADVEGHDARNKLVLLTQLAYGLWVPPAAVRTVGITGITPFDVAAAASAGYAIKLLGVSTLFDPPSRATADSSSSLEKSSSEEEVAPKAQRKLLLDMFVSPTLVPLSSPLGSTGGAGNLVQVDSQALGRTSYGGAGAGREPTANSVLADLVGIARGCMSGRPFPRPPPARVGLSIRQSTALRREMFVRGPAAVTNLLSVALWRQGRTFSPCNIEGEGGGDTIKAFRVHASYGELQSLISRAASKVAKSGGQEEVDAVVQQVAVYPVMSE